MSNFIAVKSLGKSYTNNVETKLLSNGAKTQLQKDMDALKVSANTKREARMSRMDNRDNNRVTLDIKIGQEIVELKVNEVADIKSIEKQALEQVENRLIEAKEKTNVLARKYGLAEPNNPEALKHDRLHCFGCDRRLHNPNAYKDLDSEIANLFDDDSVRHLCCWCFGAMNSEQITSIRSTDDITKEIRLAIYNPESIVDTNIDIKDKVDNVKKMTKEYELYLKAKMKKYQNVVNMIGTVKHDYLLEGDQFENQVMYRAKTRYNACTL